MTGRWPIGAAAALAVAAGLAFVQTRDTGTAADVEGPDAYPSGQPIAFPHDQHAGTEPGQNGMDCMFCHFSAERSVDAGIPPVATCMGCHQVVSGTNNPEEIEKLRGYWQRQEPIPWVRIYKISDHAHFPHMRHVAAGFECQTCHGEVQTQQVLSRRDPVWGGDNMGWCVDCHRTNGASDDCAVCHY